jgi:3-deoxy-manno-octulosonate cytidylyltransferase (CMP-KDO synthetase)
MGPALEGLAVLIPARLASTRLPRKLLLPLGDSCVLGHTWRRACAAVGPERVWIATDSEEISCAARAFGAAVLMTGEHRCGSDRVAAAARSLAPAPARIINLQGDEPLVDPEALRAVAAALSEDGRAIVTCGAPLADVDEWWDPAVVKVVAAHDDRVLYFSRAPIPGSPSGIGRDAFPQARGLVWRHIGLYGYARGTLEAFVASPVSALEQRESLEQMRALEAGIPVRLVRLPRAWPAVDTAEDLERVRRWLSTQSAG